ncbi:hypothetical protein [Prauserella flavalba]|uniref:hypothetical protein n=1 Tax=Prauserella flavalba TaxID=1477506 RepID=UPI0036E64265
MSRRRMAWGGVLFRAASSSSSRTFTLERLDEFQTLRMLGDHVAKISDGTVFMAADARVTDIERALLVMDPSRYPNYQRPMGPLFLEDTREESRSARYVRLARERREEGRPDPRMEQLAALACSTCVSPGLDGLEAEAVAIVLESNRLRATAGLPPLLDLDETAATGAALAGGGVRG